MCWGGGLGRGVGFKEEEKTVDCGVTEDPAMMELMKLIVDKRGQSFLFGAHGGGGCSGNDRGRKEKHHKCIFFCPGRNALAAFFY